MFNLGVLTTTLTGGFQVSAATSSTNYDGLYYTLVLPRTNVIAWEPIEASIGFSNGVAVERHADIGWGEACKTPYGSLIISNLDAQKRMDIVIPMPFRYNPGGSTIGSFIPGERREWPVVPDLTLGYGLTNVGVYSVQAVESFFYVEDPNRQFTLTTPPLYLYITNGTPKNPVTWPWIWLQFATNAAQRTTNKPPER